jgi:hypothetical protein
MRSLTLKDIDDDFVYVSDIVEDGAPQSSPALQNCKLPSNCCINCRILTCKALNYEFLPFVSSYVDGISETLRPLSLKIHDNPELNFKEYIAHETLVKFMRTRKGWKVTPSAYGIETAFIAEFDSGKKGAVISYNAEYGMVDLRQNY